MKILSFHPFSLYENGGGNRILRRLYQGREAQVTALVISGVSQSPKKGAIREVIVKAQPVNRSWMRWYLRKWIADLRLKTFKELTVRRIQKAAAGINYDVLHVVNHSPFSAALCTNEFLNGKRLWVSFHDYYGETGSSFDDARILWNHADRRLVISPELGNKYQQLFGHKPYEIITDGVSETELGTPAIAVTQPVSIYFAGLLHMSYLPLFNALADALDLLSKQDLRFKLVLRATQQLSFLNNRSFEIEYRPLTLNNAELKAELDSAAILYLPIKFVSPDFYLYSLSTKMVGYLGASGTILYHGPADSAACHLLKMENAAVCCASLNEYELAESISTVLNGKQIASANAKLLAEKQFSLSEIQQRFWEIDRNDE